MHSIAQNTEEGVEFMYKFLNNASLTVLALTRLDQQIE
jgi:hypothetical protein